MAFALLVNIFIDEFVFSTVADVKIPTPAQNRVPVRKMNLTSSSEKVASPNTNNQKVHYNNDSFGGYTYIGMNPLLNYQFDILLISNFFHSNYHSLEEQTNHFEYHLSHKTNNYRTNTDFVTNAISTNDVLSNSIVGNEMYYVYNNGYNIIRDDGVDYYSNHLGMSYGETNTVESFSLNSGNSDPLGITTYEDRFYVTDTYSSGENIRL